MRKIQAAACLGCVLLGVLAGIAPAVYAQSMYCLAGGVTEKLTTPGPIPNPQNGQVDLTYYVKTGWNCGSAGSVPGCIVCEQDVLCQQAVPGGPFNPMTGYTLYSQDGPKPCNTSGWTNSWTGQIYNIPKGFSYQLKIEYKIWTSQSKCDSPTGLRIVTSYPFTIPPG